jgi:hypothetical protein
MNFYFVCYVVWKIMAISRSTECHTPYWTQVNYQGVLHNVHPVYNAKIFLYVVDFPYDEFEKFGQSS